MCWATLLDPVGELNPSCLGLLVGHLVVACTAVAGSSSSLVIYRWGEQAVPHLLLGTSTKKHLLIVRHLRA